MVYINFGSGRNHDTHCNSPYGGRPVRIKEQATFGPASFGTFMPALSESAGMRTTQYTGHPLGSALKQVSQLSPCLGQASRVSPGQRAVGSEAEPSCLASWPGDARDPGPSGVTTGLFRC
jgi:hypothetical protein